jgi:cobaltochelatase CobN
LWDTTASRTVTSDDWREIKQVYVEDSLDLGMDRFFDQYNPHAQQVLLGNLLGAASRGQWQASTADKAEIAAKLAQSVAAHGIACEANMCRNPALTRLIAEALEGTSDGAALVERYAHALKSATTATTDSSSTDTSNLSGRTAPGRGRIGAPGSLPNVKPRTAKPPNVNPPSVQPPSAATASANLSQVTGQVLEVVPRPAARSASPTTAGGAAMWVFLVSISLACVVIGWLRQGRMSNYAEPSPSIQAHAP